MLGKLLFAGGVISVILLFILGYTTTPSTIGPLGILIVFILIYIVILCILSFLLFGSSLFLQKILNLLGRKKPFSRLSLLRSYYFSSVIALAPVMLLAIQSVGDLSFYDVLLATFFVLISCVYVAKRTN
jgi:hypothetical protein